MKTTANVFVSDSPPRFRAATLDERIVEMRRMLATMKHASASDTLRLLRERFPDIPLRDRIRALSGLPN